MVLRNRNRVLKLLIVLLTVSFCNTIYVPNDNVYDQKSTNNFDVKTLGWQKNGSNRANVQMHHNYSKVHHNNPPGDFLPQQQNINDGLDFSETIDDRVSFSESRRENVVVFQDRNVRVYKKCPKDATGPFVYEYSCGQFLNCWKGRGSVQNCAPGTLFNPESLECDYAEKVRCISGPNRVGREILIKVASSRAACPRGFSGLIPHYTVCTKYIQCNNGEEIPMDCPAGTIFDIKSNMCDFPYKSECATSSKEEGTEESGHQNVHRFPKRLVVIKPYHRNITYKFTPTPLDDNTVSSYTGVDSTGRRYHILGGDHQNQRIKINDQMGEFFDQSENVDQWNVVHQNSNITGYQEGSVQQGFRQENQHGFRQENQQGTLQRIPQGFQHGTFQRIPQGSQHGTYQGTLQGTSQGTQQRIPQGSYEGTHQGAFQGIPQGSQQGIYQATLQGTSQGTQQRIPQGSYQGTFQGIPQGSQQGTYQTTSHGTSQGTQQRIPQGSYQGTHQGTFQGIPQESQQGTYQMTSHGASQGTQQRIPQGSYEGTFHRVPQGSQQEIYQGTLQGTSQGTQQRIPQGNYQGTFQGIPQGSQQGTYQTTSHGTSQGTQQTIPQGSYQGTHQGAFQGIPQGFQQGIYQATLQGTSQGTQQTIPQGSYQGTHQGAFQGIPQGSQQGTYQITSHGSSQGTQQRIPQGSYQGNFQGIPQGSQQGTYQGTFQGTSQGTQQRIPQGTFQENFSLTNEEIQNFGFTQNPCLDFTMKIFEHPNNCSLFLECFQGKLYLGTCTFGTSFNPKTKICEYYNCQKNGRDKNVKNLSPKCPPGESGLFPHPSDCKKFLNCDHGRTFIQDCGPGTVFNPKINVCDWPHNVKCNETIDLRAPIVVKSSYRREDESIYDQNDAITRFYGVNPKEFCVGKEGSFENLKNCTTFFHCRNGVLSIGICHVGANFNPSKNDCDNHYKCRSQNYWDQGQHGAIQLIDQNSINFKQQTTRPVLTTDTNADYIFELDDLVEAEPDMTKVCGSDDFVCDGGRCLKQSALCDGNNDCDNGEDETNCGSFLTQFKQTKKTKMAVKEVAKFRNATVALCAKKCLETDAFKCKAFNYRKNDGMCFILDTNVGQTGSLFLLPNYDYYENQNFSVDCSGKFVCSNQKCVENSKICDGKFDCVEKEDEKNCDATKIGYSLQLVGSNSSHEGALQVKAFGKVGFVCDDQFGTKDAHVVCRELGFEEGALEVKGNSYFDVPMEIKDANLMDVGYLMDDVSCNGNETSLKECNFNGWGNHNCMPKEIVGVVCKSSQSSCPKDKWKCETVNECIPLDFLCDHVSDCSDKSDEASQYCESPTEIRLTNGKRASEGRLEVKFHGTWGTVCDDDFNDDAAKVVCRYLGYRGPATAKKDGFYGPGKGPIWLDQVFCQGNETTLQECDHWDWGKHNCDHSEDVGVSCDDYNTAGTPRNIKTLRPPKKVFPASCGLRNDDIFAESSDVHFRVVKGSVAEKGMYPWQASIRVKSQSSQEHWCGAVVVSESFVLTAAHCLSGYQKGGFVIVAGDYDRNEDEGTEQVANIEEFYIHEDFRKGTKMNNDLALVKLKGTGFNLGGHVRAICLPNSNFQEEGANCTISGFGSVKSGKAVASRELRAAFIPVQTREVCAMPHIYGDALTEGMICAGTLEGGTDACDGDSGGPLACLSDGVFTLAGLTSWGQHCGYANKPGVYVKISHYRSWIDRIMKKHSS